MNEQEIDAIVECAVRKTFVRMGIDTSDPIEMQRDFHTLRDWRKSSEQIRTYGTRTAIGILVVGTLGALWVGLQHVFTGK